MMKRLPHIHFFLVSILICLIEFLPQINLYAQESSNPMQEQAFVAANQFLKVFLGTDVVKKDFARLGFKSLGEATNSKLGSPYSVVVLGLNDLKTYLPAKPIEAILKDTAILQFPVIANGKYVTKLEIVNIKGKWVPGEFGGTTTTQVQALADLKERIPLLLRDRQISEPQQAKMLRIPSLFAEFLYIKSPQGEFLIPVMEQPQRYKLENGNMYKAQEILEKLSKYAHEIDGGKVR